jgi:hypothetical protein
LTCKEISPPTKFDSQTVQPHSVSLCRLRYPDPPIYVTLFVLGFIKIVLCIITVEILLLHTLCKMRIEVRGCPKCTRTSDHQEWALVEAGYVFRLNSLAALGLFVFWNFTVSLNNGRHFGSTHKPQHFVACRNCNGSLSATGIRYGMEQ